MILLIGVLCATTELSTCKLWVYKEPFHTVQECQYKASELAGTLPGAGRLDCVKQPGYPV